MPSTSTPSPSPFLSLNPDSDSRRSRTHSVAQSTRSFSSLNRPVSSSYSYVNGSIYQSVNASERTLPTKQTRQHDPFLRATPQSHELPRDLPRIDDDGHEILVQVLAIGLSPVDWQGAEGGVSWKDVRDVAGIVLQTPTRSRRIQQGDVVFGPVTDTRSARELVGHRVVVTTTHTVARLPPSMTAEEGAALGVPFVSAALALAVSFGLDCTALGGPDFVRVIRHLDPEGIRDEFFGGIDPAERAQPGDWLAIWGAGGATGQMALQIAKLAGLKVACVADLANHGSQLSELGADVLVDQDDPNRAVEILRAVTDGGLRFGLDTVSKSTAGHLAQALQQSNNGSKSHLAGLGGLPRPSSGIINHEVSMDIIRETPDVGEKISQWVEKLLVAKRLKLPEVEIASTIQPLGGGGGGERSAPPPSTSTPAPVTAAIALPALPGAAAPAAPSHDLAYADQLNADPNRVKFAYWVPNVSGGLVISKIPQRTNWDLKSNQYYAQVAERVGFEYALSQIRFMAGYGAENQHEPVSFSQALLMSTERLKVIAALLPGPWNPSVAAKMIASIDNYTGGRVCVNVVSGWFRAEFASIGQWWLDHAERYRRSREFIECLKGIWTNEAFTYKGDFYQFNEYPLKPKPLVLPGRPHPEIFQGGNSTDAQENAGLVSDYYFMNGNTLDGFQQQIKDVSEKARKNGRAGQVKFALNAFIICRDTEDEAIRVLQEIQGKADKDAVDGFRQQVQNAGAATANQSGMWADSKFEDLVQYNDGFKTKLIGTKHQIAERICLLKSLGVSIILTAFLHYDEEIEQFGREVLPLVRELEKQGRGSDEAFEVARTGHVYRTKPQPTSPPAQLQTKEKQEDPKAREPEKAQNGSSTPPRTADSKPKLDDRPTRLASQSLANGNGQPVKGDRKVSDAKAEADAARSNSSLRNPFKGFGRRFSKRTSSN